MVNNLNKLKNLTGIVTSSLGMEKELRLKYLLDRFNLIEYLENCDPELKTHTLAMIKHVKTLFKNYTDNIPMNNKYNLQVETELAALFHDIGKIKYFKMGSKYDTLNTEFILRKYELNGIAQAVRKNPYLFLNDLRNGLLTIPQLIVSYADLLVGYNGAILSMDSRIEDITVKNPNIDKKFLSIYSNILERLYKNKVIRTPHSKAKIAFFERLDGRYPIVDDEAHLGKVSSYHIAKELESMGYEASIFSDFGSDFKHSGVNFYGMGNDILEAYSAGKKFNYVFITGWTSLFKELKKNHDVLPLLVFRSLKKESLTEERLEVPVKYPSRSIFVSKESVDHVNKYSKKKIVNPRIIENGFAPVFYYSEDEIKDQFVFSGAFIYEKGAPEVIEIAKAFPDYKCYILGSGTMYGKDDYSNELPSNIIMLGEVDQQTIAEYYRTSLFSLSMIPEDRLFETFGKSVVESQICGCPVIGLINGGLRTTILNNKMNSKLKKYDLQKIVNIINSNIENYRNPLLRKVLSNIATNRFSSWRSVAVNYMIAANEELIDSLTKDIYDNDTVMTYLYS